MQRCVIWDEAHEIVTAEGYREVMNRVSGARALSVPSYLVSASITPRMVPLLMEKTSISNPVIIRSTTARTNIGVAIWPTTFKDAALAAKQAINTLTFWLNSEMLGKNGKVIMYCRTKAVIEGLKAVLEEDEKVAVDVYHGGLSEEEQRRSLQSYATPVTAKNHVMLATSALGLGFDDNQVMGVICVGAPDDMVALDQQLGRAGRGMYRGVGVVLPLAMASSHEGIDGTEGGYTCGREELKKMMEDHTTCRRRHMSHVLDATWATCMELGVPSDLFCDVCCKRIGEQRPFWMGHRGGIGRRADFPERLGGDVPLVLVGSDVIQKHKTATSNRRLAIEASQSATTRLPPAQVSAIATPCTQPSFTSQAASTMSRTQPRSTPPYPSPPTSMALPETEANLALTQREDSPDFEIIPSPIPPTKKRLFNPTSTQTASPVERGQGMTVDKKPRLTTEGLPSPKASTPSAFKTPMQNTRTKSGILTPYATPSLTVNNASTSKSLGYLSTNRRLDRSDSFSSGSTPSTGPSRAFTTDTISSQQSSSQWSRGSQQSAASQSRVPTSSSASNSSPFNLGGFTTFKTNRLQQQTQSVTQPRSATPTFRRQPVHGSGTPSEDAAQVKLCKQKCDQAISTLHHALYGKAKHFCGVCWVTEMRVCNHFTDKCHGAGGGNYRELVKREMTRWKKSFTFDKGGAFVCFLCWLPEVICAKADGDCYRGTFGPMMVHAAWAIDGHDWYDYLHDRFQSDEDYIRAIKSNKDKVPMVWRLMGRILQGPPGETADDTW